MAAVGTATVRTAAARTIGAEYMMVVVRMTAAARMIVAAAHTRRGSRD